MSADAYLEAAAGALAHLDRAQIARAAAALADTVEAGGSVFAFGASHSFMVVEEMVYRTGGLMLINPIYPHGMNLSVRPMTLTSRLERVVGLGSELLAASPAVRGDALILVSTSGRNAVTIDMALLARERGLRTIGITALSYAGVASRHPSGKRLAELCDVVVDNAVPHGDAAVAVDGVPGRVGPLSSVTGCAIANALACEVAAQLAARAIDPPVFMSANVDGGDAYNARLLAQHRARIHYM